MTVYIVMGFCGSGKSHLIYGMQRRGQIDRAIHDYYTVGFLTNNREPSFENSEYYEKLRDWVKNGENIAVADRMFVVERELARFMDYLKSLDEDIDIELIAFTNEPEVAKENISRRHKGKEDEEFAVNYFHSYIDRFAPGYTPFKYKATIVPTYGGELWQDSMI